MRIPKNWYEILQEELTLPYVGELKKFLLTETAAGHKVYPEEGDVFAAFHYTPFREVKAVILGQDPYHGEGQAHGLSFSVREGTPLPPSLKNIYRELSDDLGVPPPTTGSLISWAKQGVFLLNSCLTVRKNEPFSHRRKGWEAFTDAVIRKLALREDPVVFLLWGKAAQEKEPLLHPFPRHKILKAAHPSPYSVAGFYGCKHFSQTNRFLHSQGKDPIRWVPSN